MVDVSDTGPIRLLGLAVRCDRPLPGELLDRDHPVDVVIEQASSRSATDGIEWIDQSDWPRVSVVEGCTTLMFDDDAVFEVDAPSRRIVYATFDELDDLTFAHEVIDAVLPRFAAMLGEWVLHGGSVAGPAGAVVLVGASGAGKSTLVASLAASGRQFLGDDSAVIRGIDGIDHVAPSGTSLRLYEDSASVAFAAPVLGPRMAHWSSKRLLMPMANGLEQATAPAPLRAIVELVEGGVSPELIRLDGGATFELLARNSFDLPDDRPTAGLATLERWAPLAGRVAAYRLTRPFDLDQLTAVCELLKPLLDGEG